MSKQLLYCFNCESEFSVTFAQKDEPSYCVFCGTPIEADEGYEEPEEE